MTADDLSASSESPGDIGDLMALLDASPSPYHAVGSISRRLLAAGFEPLQRTAAWDAVPELWFVVSSGALVAGRRPAGPGRAPFRIIGAHTDSPGLRVKPQPDLSSAGWKQLGVEVYGGALLNSWLDRDLGVAGRVVLADGSVVDVIVDEAVCRIPQLAIHLDRDVNDKGLVLDRQNHLTPVWGTGTTHVGEFRAWLADQLDVGSDNVAWWDLALFDRTPAAVLGADASLLASGRLDNLASCWAATDALLAAAPSRHHHVIALFDHEEVGSESTSGAAAPLLEHVLERVHLVDGGTRDSFLSMLAASTCVSADNAHAVHPNYPERHEPGHRPIVNHGPAIKVNANQRYATTATAAAHFRGVCEAAGIPWQVFVSRNSMPCGSTIGPITATRLGIETIDVGVPQLSMHSARELCGVSDPVWMAAALRCWFVS